MASNEKYTVLYGRLSQEDTQKTNKTDDSDSIQNQKLLLKKYAAEKRFIAILLDDIWRVTHFARQSELRFAEHIRKKQGKEAQQEITVFQKKIDTMQKRQAELTKLFKRLYEDSVLGRIPDEQYRILSQEYTAEQKEIQELTAEILRVFIKRVEVGEWAEKYSRTALQEARIYYHDIGLVDELPENVADSLKEEIPNEVAWAEKGGCAETQPPSTGTTIKLYG